MVLETRERDADVSYGEGIIAVVCLMFMLLGTSVLLATQAIPPPVSWWLRGAALVGIGQALSVAAAVGWQWLRFGAAAVSPVVGPLSGSLTSLGLVLQIHGLPAAALSSSAFWMQPFAVFTCVVLAAACRRRALAAWLCLLTGTYLAGVVLALHGHHVGTGTEATLAANALAFPAFAAAAAVVIGFVRDVARESMQLRQQLALSSALSARTATRIQAHRVAHDLGKAFLRELVAGRVEGSALADLALAGRHQIRLRLSGGPLPDAGLRVVVAETALPFLAAHPSLRADLSALEGDGPVVPVALTDALREALNNATFHAPRAEIRVSAETSRGRAVVRVHDSGPGCDAPAVARLWRVKPGAFAALQAAGGDWSLTSDATGTLVEMRYPFAATPTRGTCAG